MNPFAARKERLEKIKEHKIDELKAKLGDIEGRQGDGDGAMTFKLPENSTDYEAENFDKYLPKAALQNQAPTEWSGRTGASTQYEPPSRAWQCAYKLQNGFVIGASLGSAIGFLYGTWAAVAYRHILYLPIAVVQSGGAFGLFLACGTVIRCEEPDGLTGLQRASCYAAAASAAARPAALSLTGQAQRRATNPTSSLTRELVADVREPSRSAVLAAVLTDEQ